MPAYDLPFTLIRHVLGASRVPSRVPSKVPQGDEGEDDRPCKLAKMYLPGLIASREFTKSGAGVKRGRGAIVEPEKEANVLSHIMWRSALQANTTMYEKAIKANTTMHENAIKANVTMHANAIADDLRRHANAAQINNRKHAEAINAKDAMDKIVREELARVTCEKTELTVLATKEREVAADKLKELQQTCQAQTKEAGVAREALKSANRGRDEQEKAFRDYRTTAEAQLAEMTSRAEAAERSLATAESTVAVQQAAGLKLEQDLAVQQAAGLKLEQGLAALQEEHALLKEACSISQNTFTALQGQHSLLQQEHIAQQSQHAQAHSALAQHINALELQLAGQTQQPLSAQVPSQLQPVLNWVQQVARVTSPSLTESAIIDHVVEQGNDMAALEATVKDVQAEALRVMPQFVAFVQQGPTGWVSKAQASSVPTPASAPASTPAMPPASASSSASAFSATNTSAARGAPSVPVAAPITASLGGRAVDGSKSQQTDQIGATSSRSRRRVAR